MYRNFQKRLQNARFLLEILISTNPKHPTDSTPRVCHAPTAPLNPHRPRVILQRHHPISSQLYFYLLHFTPHHHIATVSFSSCFFKSFYCFCYEKTEIKNKKKKRKENQKQKENMLLKASPAFSILSPPQKEVLNHLFSSGSSVNSNLRFSSAKNGTGVVVCASKGAHNSSLTGVVFAPFEEVKKELDLVPTVPQVSLARHKFTDECEAAINEQIK